MIGLVAALDDPVERAAIEADLSLHYGLDLADYYRRRTDGRRVLTLRQIMVRLRHLPIDSAWRHIDQRETSRTWSPEAELLDELRRLLRMVHLKGGKDPGPHPLSPASPTPAERLAKARDRRRMHEVAEERERARQAWIAQQVEEG